MPRCSRSPARERHGDAQAVVLVTAAAASLLSLQPSRAQHPHTGSFLAPSPPVSHPLLGHVCLPLISPTHPLLSTPPKEGTDLIFSTVSSMSITPPRPLLGCRAICSPISSPCSAGSFLLPLHSLSFTIFPSAWSFPSLRCVPRGRGDPSRNSLLFHPVPHPLAQPCASLKTSSATPGLDSRGVHVTPHSSLG